MKKVLLLLGLCPMFMNAQTTIFEENFDSYTAGSYAGIESPYMSTWSLAPGGTEDALISNAQSSSPSNSVEIVGQSGPIDAMILFPQTYDAGQYKFTMKFYVVAGQAGYFNCQESDTPGLGWKCDIFFANDGTGYVSADGTEIGGTFNYTQDTWFDVEVLADLSADQGTVTIDGTVAHTFTWSTGVAGTETYTRWGGVNLFAYGPADTPANYFVDDLKFEDVTDYSSVEENEDLSFSVMPNPSNGEFAINMNNNENYDLMIMDLSGKVVYSDNAITNGHNLNLDLEAGIYFVTLFNEAEKVVQQIVIK